MYKIKNIILCDSPAEAQTHKNQPQFTSARLCRDRLLAAKQIWVGCILWIHQVSGDFFFHLLSGDLVSLNLNVNKIFVIIISHKRRQVITTTATRFPRSGFSIFVVMGSRIWLNCKRKIMRAYFFNQRKYFRSSFFF